MPNGSVHRGRLHVTGRRPVQRGLGLVPLLDEVRQRLAVENPVRYRETRATPSVHVRDALQGCGRREKARHGSDGRGLSRGHYSMRRKAAEYLDLVAP